jgi:hypothetical protein
MFRRGRCLVGTRRSVGDRSLAISSPGRHQPAYRPTSTDSRAGVGVGLGHHYACSHWPCWPLGRSKPPPCSALSCTTLRSPPNPARPCACPRPAPCSPLVAHRDQVGAEDRRLGTASRGNWWTPARGVVSDNRGRVRAAWPVTRPDLRAAAATAPVRNRLCGRCRRSSPHSWTTSSGCTNGATRSSGSPHVPRGSTERRAEQGRGARRGPRGGGRATCPSPRCVALRGGGFVRGRAPASLLGESRLHRRHVRRRLPAL